MTDGNSNHTLPADLLPPSPPPESDPPPPYPSRDRRTRARAQRQRLPNAPSQHTQQASNDTDHDPLLSPLTWTSDPLADDVDETTPFLPHSSPRLSIRREHQRPRGLSFTSTIRSTVSGAPSLAHTVISLFQDDGCDDDVVDHHEGEVELENEIHEARNHNYGLLSIRSWQKYLRPLVRKAYWSAVLHLLVINFPYALSAWVYLFVFTLTGTALLMALPLGALLCFFDLLGARVFARGELALQKRFHGPLAHSVPYTPRPIFTRYREPTVAEIEAGTIGQIRELSFYKNSYAMFTDSTSYQALFYFLVIKPSITLLLSIILIVLVPVSLILIFPAPPVLRATRKLGIWQANVAFEGLYLAVR